MSRHAGIPLLSGPPPPHPGPTQSACRKCGKEFNLLFNRRKECMHCGYDYCSSCTDYQALLPRHGVARGYDLAPVCAFCIDVLSVTTLGRAQLRALPLGKLRRYIDAYSIPVKNPIDKNDLVDAAIAARTPQGCLSPVNEEYYRKHSVPLFSTTGSSPSTSNRNTFTHTPPSNSANNNSRSNRPFPRPDLDPNRRQRPHEAPYATYTPRTPQNQARSRTTSAPSDPRTTPRASEQPNVPRPTPTASAGRQSTPQPTQPSTPQSAPPPPPMSTLVTLPRSSLSALSVGTLKQILWEARVRIPPGVVEKEELVERAWALVEEEKRKDEEALESADFDGEWEEFEEFNREEEFIAESVNQEAGTHRNTADEEHFSVPHTDSGLPSFRPATPQLPTSPPKHPGSPNSKPRPHSKPASAERSGLCVVCQDEEACIAIVDCGHLALCRDCSELILSSSKECPLCRTRIVTEARLLRIFKS